MKLWQCALAVVATAGLVAAAFLNKAAEEPGDKMTAAAEKFLGSLNAEQKQKAVFAFDDKERTNWHFVPLETRDKKPRRKGLPLEDMTETQRKAALELLKVSTSETGYSQATTIMSLESILKDAEKGRGPVRNPNWYFFTVFGTPSKTGKWGWRVEGHHLALNFTIDKGKVVSTTPAFFGANPAVVQQGPRKGLETLPEVQKLARELFASLDADQQKVALQKQQFREIGQADTAPKVGPPVGLPASKMKDKQKETLMKLVAAYARRMPKALAEAELTRVKEAGTDKIHFALARDTSRKGQPYTYRVQGPTFVIEFLNEQSDSYGNPANHIHSAWRNLQGDFGLTK